MIKTKWQFFTNFLLLIVTVVTLSLTASFAQIGNLGVYGSAPTPAATPFTCGTPTKVRMESYPEIDGGLNMTLPLNGYKNFNFYYTEDGNGFLSGGGYKLTYITSAEPIVMETAILHIILRTEHTQTAFRFGLFLVALQLRAAFMALS